LSRNAVNNSQVRIPGKSNPRGSTPMMVKGRVLHVIVFPSTSRLHIFIYLMLEVETDFIVQLILDCPASQ
jgi:hypothetical protein